MLWNQENIVLELGRLHKANKDLSYNGLARKRQELVSAAAYHFGSYRKALERAGIDYAEVTRRPRWTKPIIVSLIQTAQKKGENLSWSAVTKRRDEMGRAAFAAIQPRLFGKWKHALAAAGLDANKVSRYRKWEGKSIGAELRRLFNRGKALNSGALQAADPGLHAAAVRHHGTYDAALKSAKIDPIKTRLRTWWEKDDVIKAIKAAHKAGKNLSDSTVRREISNLYGAASRLFGTFTAARTAAKVSFTPRKKRRSRA